MAVTAFNSTSDFKGSPRTAVAIAAGLLAASLLAGVLIVELFCHVFTSIGQVGNETDRLITFLHGSGTVLEDHGPIFTYAPHADVRNLAVYFSRRGYVSEYDYRFHTNNFGLVQDNDVKPGRPSLLLLGDSFTEGMGAEPWFRKLIAQNKTPYQLVNGGIRGTGFEQWKLLEHYLASRGVRVERLIVLFISDDYARQVFNISPAVLHCLASRSLDQCPDESIYNNYPLPPADELPRWVDRIRASRETMGNVMLRRMGRLLPASHLVYSVLKMKLSSAYAANERSSRDAIARFTTEHGAENVAFVHLPQKDEIHGPNAVGVQARHDIKSAGGRLYDGFKSCGLTRADYYVHDEHPNAQGYDKIARCVGSVVQSMTPPDRAKY